MFRGTFKSVHNGGQIRKFKKLFSKYIKREYYYDEWPIFAKGPRVCAIIVMGGRLVSARDRLYPREMIETVDCI